ncbi:hypothetical protein CVT24_001453 [Panaeolus cyanescens]|uniref:Uncharacterized protein n=1 Tax=Panaeolus cyanescens TaxID=181874 RepID=A0A409WSJ9_9AGAR|nr:hypothetical protein CVT24_001453 [Panaeolus cyanescens]
MPIPQDPLKPTLDLASILRIFEYTVPDPDSVDSKKELYNLLFVTRGARGWVERMMYRATHFMISGGCYATKKGRKVRKMNEFADAVVDNARLGAYVKKYYIQIFEAPRREDIVEHGAKVIQHMPNLKTFSYFEEFRSRRWEDVFNPDARINANEVHIHVVNALRAVSADVKLTSFSWNVSDYLSLPKNDFVKSGVLRYLATQHNLACLSLWRREGHDDTQDWELEYYADEWCPRLYFLESSFETVRKILPGRYYGISHISVIYNGEEVNLDDDDDKNREVLEEGSDGKLEEKPAKDIWAYVKRFDIMTSYSLKKFWRSRPPAGLVDFVIKRCPNLEVLKIHADKPRTYVLPFNILPPRSLYSLPRLEVLRFHITVEPEFDSWLDLYPLPDSDTEVDVHQDVVAVDEQKEDSQDQSVNHKNGPNREASLPPNLNLSDNEEDFGYRYTMETFRAESNPRLTKEIVAYMRACPTLQAISVTVGCTLYNLLFVSPHLKTHVERQLYSSMTKNAFSKSHELFLNTILRNERLAGYVHRYAFVMDSEFVVYPGISGVRTVSRGISGNGNSREIKVASSHGAIVGFSSYLNALLRMKNLKHFIFYEKNRHSYRPKELYTSILSSLKDVKLSSIVWHVAGALSFSDYGNILPISQFLSSQPELRSVGLCTEDYQIEDIEWGLGGNTATWSSGLRHVEASMKMLNTILPDRRITSVTILDFHVRCTMEDLTCASSIAEWESIEEIILHSWGDEGTFDVLNFISKHCRKLRSLHFPTYFNSILLGRLPPSLLAPLQPTLQQLTIGFRPTRRSIHSDDPLDMTRETRVELHKILAQYFAAFPLLRQIHLGSYVDFKPSSGDNDTILKGRFQTIVPKMINSPLATSEAWNDAEASHLMRDADVEVELGRFWNDMKMWPPC